MQPNTNDDSAAPTPRGSVGRTELSEREREILKLVATGASNKQIAQLLVISPNTVKVHLRNIFAKIGVATRTEAALFAIRTLKVTDDSDPAVVQAEAASTVATAPALGIDIPDNTAASATEATPGRSWRTPAWRLWLAAGASTLLLVALATAWYLNSQRATQRTTAAPPASAHWQSLAPLPTARSGLALVAYENRIYAIAGETTRGVTGVVERYDPAGNVWSSLASKPVPVADVEAAVIGGHVYVPGGRLASGVVTSTLEMYDTANNTWARGAPLPQPVSAYALVTHEGRLYLFGGWDGSHFLDSAYAYDPAQDQWKILPPMPTARGFAGAAEAGGRIYVIGGYDGQNALAENQVFLPERQSGTETAWDTSIPLPQPRYHSGVTSLADVVYVVGGDSTTASDPSVIGYSPLSHGWQPLEAPPTTSWSQMGLAAVGSRLFVMGGRANGAITNINQVCQVLYTILLPVVP